MKRQNQLNIKRGLLSKLVLFVALLLGSSNAWGEDITIFGGSIASGWTYTIASSGDPAYVSMGNLYEGAGNAKLYTSTNKVLISSTQAIKITAKRSSSKMEPSIKIKYSEDGKTWNTVKELTVEDIPSSSESSENEITFVGNYYLQFDFYYASISSILIINKALYPTLSISPVEDASFGNVTADATKSYTITNNSGETANVVPTITGTGASSFSVTDGAGVVINSGKDIASGATETFKVKFTYNPEDLNNEKTATITFTPNKDAEEAISINASATAILDAPIFELSYEGEKDAAFGEVTTNASKTYTVRNAGTQPMTVNISLSDASYYSLSSEDFTESTTSIEAGESKEFTVTFNYPSPLTIDELTERTATVTVTPTYNVELAETINTSATVVTDVVWDEAKATTWGTGTKNVLVKIQPQSGWNTLCIPVTTTNYTSSIFGTCTVYKLNSYSDDGVISFSKVNYLGANKPCLVYVESAPDNSKGVLLTGVNIPSSSATSPGTEGPKENNVGGSAIFKGTFAPIGAGGLEGKYGITSESKLGKGNASASIKGFRAYLEVSGAAPARIMTIDSEGETTDLGFVRMVDQEAKDVYNLQGQKVEKGRKGIYIVNGKKVVIK